MPVHFHKDVTGFSLMHPAGLRQWLKRVIVNEGKKEGTLNYIFCDDEKLLQINREYLQHDYYTDIITFDTSGEEKIISGDIFISVDRVKDNAGKYKVTFEDELYRVMVHGLLHLLGYKDKKTADIKEIRAKEDHYLRKIHSSK